MKETKRRLETFSFYDRTGLEAHLARMAAEGWLVEKIGQFFWYYRKIEPKTLTFSVTYFPKASQFDPRPSEEQETFYDFCAHTGWVLAAANAQLQVFYNERPDPVPIETDPVQEVETIHRAMKKSFLPAQLLLAVCGGFKICGYLSQDLYRLAFQFDLAGGILAVILGLLMAVRSESVMRLLKQVLGIVLLMDGLLKIHTALDASQFGIEQWRLI